MKRLCTTNRCKVINSQKQSVFFGPPSSNLFKRTGGDHRGGRTQPGWRTFMMTCLHWILGYMRLEIWRKIGLSGDWWLCTAYALVVVHATIGLDSVLGIIFSHNTVYIDACVLVCKDSGIGLGCSPWQRRSELLLQRSIVRLSLAFSSRLEFCCGHIFTIGNESADTIGTVPVPWAGHFQR